MLKGNQDQCPNCGKFVEYGADGYYDREWPYHETAQTVQYCNESCCDAKRAKDKATHDRARDIEFEHDCQSLVAA